MSLHRKASMRDLIFNCVLMVIVSSAAVAESAGSRIPAIPFELTGTVLDWNTKQPLPGAYVLASYRAKAGFTTWCVKTRGMYTAPDGKFHFPVEKLDGLNPYIVSAIKPDYVHVIRGEEIPSPEVFRKQNADSYGNRKLFLAKQDSRAPDFRFGYGDEFCNHAPTPEAARAGVQFLRIELSEMIKYGAGEQQIGAVRSMIRLVGFAEESDTTTKSHP